MSCFLNIIKEIGHIRRLRTKAGKNKIGSILELINFHGIEIRFGDQIVHFSQSSGVHFSTIIHSTGSTATQAGLVLGQCISDYDTTVIGMAASQRKAIQVERVRELASATAHMLDMQFDAAKIVVDDAFIGPGYALQSEAGNAAARLFACTEGILLDNVYTAKAAAGLIHYATSGKFGAEDSTLFIHTGGNTGLYY